MTSTASASEFDELTAAARTIADRSYCPYSHFRVGAAGYTEDGRLVVGCNVENAGYGVTLCAECGLVSDLIAGGGGRLRSFVCVGAPDGDPADRRAVIMPCGRCRQLLSEHAGPGFTMLSPQGVLDLDGLLPQAFGPADLET
ncbi:cytidine deaminase [Brachybacterium endophyticum]|uniref:Cytidine deaminase n=1 Tax=Brachybacterium endophyticum TaxID=2182385 RepID=A0A2U2RGR3_9MICO|nr:cytidine deaminase [Brachybacterium endophyticum]PWH05011.1 cytidine deaminase [Brachybacterium endophyticum]